MFKIMNPDEIRKQKIENSKWKKESLEIPQDPTQRTWLNDDEYNKIMRLHEPIYKYLINAYNFDPNLPGDNLKYPILLLGFHSMALAIELSMWGYPVTLIVENEELKKRVEKNEQVHAGNINILTYDYLMGVPQSKVIVFIDDDHTLPREKLPEFLKYLKKRAGMLISAFRDWKDTPDILKSLGKNKSISQITNYVLVISYP